MKFEDAVEIVLEIEGGGKIADYPPAIDPGGVTKWGISLGTFPELREEGIRNLTREDAVKIYLDHYWMPHCQLVPDLLRLAVFDASVHHGPMQSIKLLQKALNAFKAGLKIDGLIGPLTRRSLMSVEPKRVLIKMMRERQKFIRSLENYLPSSDGWETRLLTITFESAC